MTQADFLEELNKKTLETLVAASVALFHQVLIRESKKETIDRALEGTAKMIEEITSNFLKDKNLGPYFTNILSDEKKIEALNKVNDQVKEQVKDYAYKTYISELVR